MPDQVVTPPRSGPHAGRRVRITDAAGSQFRGLEGTVIATHSRLPCSRVELDSLPDRCTSRRYWFAHDRLEWLR